MAAIAAARLAGCSLAAPAGGPVHQVMPGLAPARRPCGRPPVGASTAVSGGYRRWLLVRAPGLEGLVWEALRTTSIPIARSAWRGGRLRQLAGSALMPQLNVAAAQPGGGMRLSAARGASGAGLWRAGALRDARRSRTTPRSKADLRYARSRSRRWVVKSGSSHARRAGSASCRGDDPPPSTCCPGQRPQARAWRRL